MNALLLKDISLEQILEEEKELSFSEVKNHFPTMLDHDIRRMCFVLVIKNKASIIGNKLKIKIKKK